MSREALAFILGRAALDQDYLERLKKDPAVAAKEMRMELSPNELAALKSLDFRGLDEFNKTIGPRKLHGPFGPP